MSAVPKRGINAVLYLGIFPSSDQTWGEVSPLVARPRSVPRVEGVLQEKLVCTPYLDHGHVFGSLTPLIFHRE